MSNKLFFLSIFYFALLILFVLIQFDKYLKTSVLLKCSHSAFNFGEKKCLFDSWNDIFNVSKYQKLIDSEILIKTAKFMIEEQKEDDEELIQFVSSQIHSPNGEKRNIFSKKLDYSEYKQSRIIDDLLLSKENGFFVEAGAYDGEKMSNSLFFELSRNWTGLLIEPIPQHFQNLLSKNRNVFSINACLAKKHPIVAKFKEMDTLSARTVHMSRGLSSSIGNDYLYVPCYPLNTIMKAINKTAIDYFSLDLEGGEYDFIKTIDFSKLDIKSISIELGTKHDQIELYSSYLKNFGFRLVSIGFVDIFFIK